MSSGLGAIRTSMAGNAPQGQEPQWGELLAEFVAATSSPITPEVERLLLEILRFEGELQLDETSPMTHRMAPEKVLKSLALKALGKWTGATYLPTMRRLQATAKPASFACAIRGVIEKVTAQTERPRHVEAVVKIRSEDGSHTYHVDCGWGGQDEVTEHETGDRTWHEDLTVLTASGMTLMSRPTTRSRRQIA